MKEIVVYRNVKEVGMKFLSLCVSFKYHIFAVASIALFKGLLDGWLWAAVACAVGGIRGWEKFIRRNDET